jgi:formylglycine-generating enzyme required for sulfatase activity
MKHPKARKRKMQKHRIGLHLLFLVLVVSVLDAQENRYRADRAQIPGPASPTPKPGWITDFQNVMHDPPSEFENWLADIQAWRTERLVRIGYNDSQYRRPEFQWARHNFIAPQVMVEERYLYDPDTSRYTVDRYLQDLNSRYGGIDSVLIWPVYPNLGIDDRNLFDFYRDLPGGFAALRKMVEDFHHHNVKVFFPMMSWDVGTRPEGIPLWDAVAKLMADINADGVNGDTFAGVPRAYPEAADKIGHPLVFQPENELSGDEQLIWDLQSWSEDVNYTFEPTISELKWLEPRHMVNICNRGARDKTDDLQSAFFNGMGYASWENIWGIWNGITPHDGEAIRRVATIERHFASFLTSPHWEPHTPTLQYGSFASKFPGDTATFWTFVNRNKYDIDGAEIRIADKTGLRYFDIYHGVELKPETQGGFATLEFSMESQGYGAILATTQPDPDLIPFLAEMKELTAKPLKEYSSDWQKLPQHMREIAASKKRANALDGMVRIPSGTFDFRVSGVEIEGDRDDGVDVQYPWEPSPRRHHFKTLPIKSFYIDKYPVTNAQFKKFLDASGYRPLDDHNFLCNWTNGKYPDGWANKPVTWVSLEDARAYASWAQKRLPHEWEWQYAAQGLDGRTYPWGNDWNSDAVPPPDHGRTMRAPTDVDAFPKGASPFGVMDTIGNVWQWTDEFVDEHTRAAVLRGSGYYQPVGALWYFPSAYKLNEHGKYLLIAPSKDRSGSVGFRCVVDVE